MRVGDTLEWLAAAAFVAAGYIEFKSIPLALTIFGIALVYFAQCLATAEIPRPRLPKLRKFPRIHPVNYAKTKWKRKVKPDASPRPS